MKELVGDGADVARRIGAQVCGAGNDGGVAMLHAVEIRPGKVIDEKGIGTGVVFREGAENAFLFEDDGLAHHGESGGFSVGAEVVKGDAKGGVFDLPLGFGVRAQLDRTIHELFEIRGGPPAIGLLGEFAGDAPIGAGGDFEMQRGRGVFESRRPNERGGQIEMSMSGIDGGIGTIDAIAIQGIFDDHGGVLAGDGPAVRIRLLDGERMTRFVEGAYVINVLGELVQRIAAGRRAAHAQLEGRIGYAGEGSADLGFMVNGVREAQFVFYGFLSQ